MFHQNPQLPNHIKALTVQDPSALSHAGQVGGENGALLQAESITSVSKKIEEDMHMLGRKIKQHEENIRFLKNQKNSLEDSILDLQVTLGKYHSSNVPKVEGEDPSHVQSEDDTLDMIRKHDKSAAGILCHLKTRHGSQASNLPLTKDVLGIVASLGKVHDDNLSRLLSEYLGLESMLAVVCLTYNGVRALEMYDTEGSISKDSGLYGLGASIGKMLDGRFRVICLETIRPYVGEFIVEDPQRRLDLLKPKISTGSLPKGFLGFAVNMIHIDSSNLSCVTPSGHGLRETLFYNLFSRLQVYNTRANMLDALPCITHGAVSLDGGIIRSNGVFSLGSREELGVKFAISSGISYHPENYIEIEKRKKELKWKQDRVKDDLQREEAMLKHVMANFGVKKQEYIKFLAHSAPYPAMQHAVQSPQGRMTPR